MGMARQRLSWDEKKVAEISKKADPYTMNQTRMNPPVEKYQTGGPDAWAETPDMKTPWKTEGRTETGHPAPEQAAAAVMAARKLEGKALQCITIAQRMLPGAADSIIEEQATDLMYLPEKSVMATLQRQVKIAQVLAGQDEAAKPAEGDESEEDENKPPVVEAKKAPAAPAEEKVPAEEPVVEAKKAPAAPAEEKVPAEEPVVEAKKAAPVPAEEKTSPEEEKQANDDLLDLILFDDATAKTGAKKLSGIVKQASVGDVSLDSLWDSPPDVSKAFK
jgi:hypothetical protein